VKNINGGAILTEVVGGGVAVLNTHQERLRSAIDLEHNLAHGPSLDYDGDFHDKKPAIYLRLPRRAFNIF
jgi:hypothetical protein